MAHSANVFPAPHNTYTTTTPSTLTDTDRPSTSATHHAQHQPKHTKIRLCIVTDPGPDPDDVKALAIAAVKHMQGEIDLVGVISNGGGQALQRAKLAKSVLKHIGCDVPVAAGSPGTAYQPLAHEYQVAGYDSISSSELADGAELLERVLRESSDRSLTFLLISGMTDLSNIMRSQPELVVAKVAHIAVMGGLVFNEVESVWEPDSAVNNAFDLDAARNVYDFCFSRGVRMSCISRNAVPKLPMDMVRRYASVHPSHPVLSYLDRAQKAGLVGLWGRLCSGKLPARCDKKWYMTTFCGIDEAEFLASGLDRLDGSCCIEEYLNGSVKPYDVCALMLTLPNAREAFGLEPKLEGSGKFQLFLDQEHMLDRESVGAVLEAALKYLCHEEGRECSKRKLETG